MSIPLIIDGVELKEAPAGASFDLTSNILKVAEPVDTQDAASKQYVDAAIAAAGGGGDFSGDYNDLTNTPDLSGFATTTYVDGQISDTQTLMNDNFSEVYTKAEVDAAIAAASGGGSVMPYSTVWRTSDSTGRGSSARVLAFNSFQNGNADMGVSPEVFGFGLDGRIYLDANKTYLLRMNLYITALPAGKYWDVTFARFFAPSTYADINNGLRSRIYSTGPSNVIHVVHEQVFKTTAAETLWCAIQATNDDSATFTLMKGSTAFAQQIA